jgi:hypothetical protein
LRVVVLVVEQMTLVPVVAVLVAFFTEQASLLLPEPHTQLPWGRAVLECLEH